MRAGMPIFMGVCSHLRWARSRSRTSFQAATPCRAFVSVIVLFAVLRRGLAHCEHRHGYPAQAGTHGWRHCSAQVWRTAGGNQAAEQTFCTHALCRDSAEAAGGGRAHAHSCIAARIRRCYAGHHYRCETES